MTVKAATKNQIKALRSALNAAGKSAIKVFFAEDKNFGDFANDGVAGEIRDGQFGKYFAVHLDGDTFAISLAKGTRMDARAYTIKSFKCVEPFEVEGRSFEEGDVIFKAFGLAEAEEE